MSLYCNENPAFLYYGITRIRPLSEREKLLRKLKTCKKHFAVFNKSSFTYSVVERKKPEYDKAFLAAVIDAIKKWYL